MELQNTLGRIIDFEGREPYGGNKVFLRFHPAEPDTGILFVTAKGNIEAKLGNASEYKSAILLKDNGSGVLHVEHLLATLYAYGIDNAMIEVNRMPSRSFSFMAKLGLATELEVIPDFENKTYGLCQALDKNMIPQKVPRRLLRLEQKIGDMYKDRLLFEPENKEGLTIHAYTDYPVLGAQELSIHINSESYNSEISRSRPYAKHCLPLPDVVLDALASIFNPSFGIGHGFDPENGIMFPVTAKKPYLAKAIYSTGDEPVRHTIMDRLGAIALLPGRLDHVKMSARFSGHANDIKMLKRVLPYLRVE